MTQRLFILYLFAFLPFVAAGQEYVAPLTYNPVLAAPSKTPLLKTTALALPFFEDFTGYSALPDASKWTDRSVYINNTMAVSPVSRGVATFDALNAQGAPYDSVNPFTYRYADSLTSQTIDLSMHTPADSIYLSFFYQPQGRGFAPETQDSLILFLKRSNGSWARVWAKEGTASQPFRQVMIPVADTAYMKAAFQFRFVNKASINLNDDVWNLDYIRMAANRNINDTAIDDLTTVDQPSNLLNDYTAMPYRQFKANVNGELATQHTFSVSNHLSSQRAVTYGYNAREQVSNTPLSNSKSNDNIAPYTSKSYVFATYGGSYNAPGLYDRVVYENKYYISDPSAAGDKANDTIVYEQVFDNYLAYDDGTAEKSYFLHQGNTLPAKTAIEFHLNQPDSLRGVAIYFGRQVPMAFSKFFDITVYRSIAINNGVNDVLYQNPVSFTPGYVDTINHFWVYKLDNPVALNAGAFYLGTTQPAQSGSDSLYFGLDVNRLGGNHLYVDYQGFWESSVIQGALMIRPLLGQPVFSTAVETPGRNLQPDWSLYPNPAQNILSVSTALPSFVYEIADAQGRILKQAQGMSQERIDVSFLSPGIYFVRILAGGQYTVPKKFIKL